MWMPSLLFVELLCHQVINGAGDFLKHRATLGQLRNVCQRLLDRLNRYLDDPQGFDLEQQPFIGPKENLSDVMLRCAQAGAKFIPLERRAYNLDEESGGEAYEDVLRALLDGKRG